MRLLGNTAISLLLSCSMVSVETAAQAPTAKPAGNAAPTQAKTSANEELIRLTMAGMSDDIVLGVVARTDKAAYDTSTEALLKLKSAGVSQRVIAAILGVSTPASESLPPAASSTPVATGELTIPDGTEIRLRLLEAVSSKTAKVDDKLRLEAVDDVKVNGSVVIAQGAKAVGTVTEARGKKSFGRAGHLNFILDVVKAVDGQNIKLRTGSKRVQGDESFVKAGVVTYLTGPFGALVKGKDVEINAGTEYTIYIDGDRKINVGAVPK